MDREVRPAKKGYNLNFIDWQNQYQHIVDSDYNGQQPPSQSPIVGMSPEIFHSIMLEQSRQMEYEQESLEKVLYGFKGVDKIKKMKAGNTNKECSICIKKFQKGEVIRVLKCKHVFHDGCLLPWLEKHSQCPNCREELKEEE